MEDLLTKYPVVHRGRATELGNLWQEFSARKPGYHRGRNVQKFRDACTVLNQAVAPVWPSLFDKASEILASFPGCGVGLSFEFPGVSYDKEKERRIVQKELNLGFSLNGVKFPNTSIF